MLGTAFVALPFAVFSGFGFNGVIVSAFISIPMFIACCIASRDQLQSMFGIIACTTFGLFVGALCQPVGRQGDVTNHLIVFAMLGCVVGLIWSELFYSRHARECISIPIEDVTKIDDNV